MSLRDMIRTNRDLGEVKRGNIAGCGINRLKVYTVSVTSEEHVHRGHPGSR